MSLASKAAWLPNELLHPVRHNLGHVMRKADFAYAKTKTKNQLRSNCAADQRLCFHYIDSTTPLLPKYKISSLQPSSVAVQLGLCRTWSEFLKNSFLTLRLICWMSKYNTAMRLYTLVLLHGLTIHNNIQKNK